MVFIRNLLKNIESKILDFKKLNNDTEKISTILNSKFEKLEKEELRIVKMKDSLENEKTKLKSEYDQKKLH